jgi:hypothetical protein
MKIMDLAIRTAISATVAVSGVIHAYLYIHGYRDIPAVGPAFLVQGSVFCALAVLILAGGPGWLQLCAAIGAAGSLVAFALRQRPRASKDLLPGLRPDGAAEPSARQR